ncbi:MAG: ATP-grasp domain-containing protein [Lachnospiraceae bacterium]|nr:ATP-grasp domain-containing protein [Robinsoniella sp.]MDY3765231.1 ATP-grasp domain-containing protein [Lachnospiraceae bacterium]
MRKLLILGAGIYQVPLIQKAKEMGLFTIAASYAGPYPGLALADKVYDTDTTDMEGILSIARSEEIDGICTTGTDVAIKSLGFVCEKCGLPGLSFSSALLATDKSKMKKSFLQGGVSTASFYQVFSLEEAIQAFLTLQPPVMVKASDSSGSRGITRAETVEELVYAYDAARSVTKKPYLLVEKFLTGHEIGVDGILQDGTWKLLLPHDKYMYKAGNTTIPAGHSFPFTCSPQMEHEIKRQMSLAALSLGLDNCAVNADLLICDDRVFVLEMGGRAGATCIPELISCYTGVDYYEQIIKNALGEKVSFGEYSEIPCISRLLFCPRAGVLTHLRDYCISQLQTEYTKIQLDYQIGDFIPSVTNGTDRIGSIVHQGFPGQSLNSLSKEMNQILSSLQAAIYVDGIPLHP